MRWVSLICVLLGCGPGDNHAVSRPGPERRQEVEAPEPPRQPISWRRARLESLGSSFIQPRTVALLIPEGSPPEGGFPFLVVTDGDLAFDDAWFGVDDALMSLVNEDVLEPWVVIAVPAIDRTPELTPSLASRRALRRGERLEQPRSGVEAFADYVVDVVLPAVEQEAPLREQGAVLGYSYGGLAALHFGLRYPDRFPRVVVMSPSLWFAQRAALFAVDHAPVLPARVWLDVGTREGDPDEDFPYMVADARQLRADLRQHDVEVGYYEAIGRPHGSNEAGPRMAHALRYALSDETCEPTSLALHAFRRQSRRGHSVPTTVLGQCADGSPRTVSARDVRLEAQGGRVSVDGIVQATRPGQVSIRVVYQGLTATTAIRFR